LLYPNDVTPRLFAISGGELYEDVAFQLSPISLYSISGRIVLSDPMITADLRLVSAHHPEILMAVAPAAIDGTFRFAGIPPGSYDVLAGTRTLPGNASMRKPLYGHIRVDVTSQDAADVTVPLAEGRELRFILGAPSRVRRCPGPVNIALSAVENWGAMPEFSLGLVEGKVSTVSGLPPGYFRVNIKPGSEGCFAREDFVVDTRLTGGEAPVEVVVTPAATLTGTLTGDRLRTRDVVVVLTASRPNSEAVRVAYPDDRLSFTFLDLRPGTYRIAAVTNAQAYMARAPGSSYTAIELEIGSGETSGLELPLPRLEEP
jgi:hypothetical protein